MKRSISLLLALVLCLSLCACGSTGGKQRAHTPSTQATTAVEPEIEWFPGTNADTGESWGEGKSIRVEEVSLGFSDTLPKIIPAMRSQEYALGAKETYAVVRCIITNLTDKDFKLIDTMGHFLVELYYDNGSCSTYDEEVYCHMVSGAGYGSVRKGNSTRSADGMTIAPQAAREVSIYIPCPSAAQEDPEVPMSVRFFCEKDGADLSFAFDRMPEPVVEEPETVPPTEAVYVPAVGDGFIPDYWLFGDALYTGEASLEVGSITLAELVTGDMRYTVEFRTNQGRKLWLQDGIYSDDYIDNGVRLDVCREQPTTGAWETYSMDVEAATFREADCFILFFAEDTPEEGGYGIVLEKTEAVATQTKGTPVGEAKTVYAYADASITVHSLTAQLLDNDFVRYTLVYTAPQGRYISFFNPPQGDVIMYVSAGTTSGQQETYFVDVKKDANNSIDRISMKFYNMDNGDFLSFDSVKFP